MASIINTLLRSGRSITSVGLASGDRSTVQGSRGGVAGLRDQLGSIRSGNSGGANNLSPEKQQQISDQFDSQKTMLEAQKKPAEDMIQNIQGKISDLYAKLAENEALTDQRKQRYERNRWADCGNSKFATAFDAYNDMYRNEIAMLKAQLTQAEQQSNAIDAQIAALEEQKKEALIQAAQEQELTDSGDGGAAQQAQGEFNNMIGSLDTHASRLGLSSYNQFMS